MKKITNFAYKIINNPNSITYEGILKLFILGFAFIMLAILFIKFIPVSAVGICFK